MFALDVASLQAVAGGIVLVIGALGLLMIALGISDGGTTATWGLLLVVVAILLVVVGNAIS